MPRTISIFIDIEGKKEDVASELQKVLGIAFEPTFESKYKMYRYVSNQTWLTLGQHEFENNAGMQFETFQYWIEVGAMGFKDPEEHYRACLDFALNIFKALKSAQKYRLLMTVEVDRMLDEYHPDAG